MTIERSPHRPYGNTLAEALEDILILVRAGHFINHALAIAGFSKQAFHAYRLKCPEAEERLEQARAEADGKLVTLVHTFAADDAKSAQWLLERRRPLEYSLASKVELTGKDGGAIQLDAVSRMSDTQLLEIAMGGAVPKVLPVDGEES